jgi:hypothetical protein
VHDVRHPHSCSIAGRQISHILRHDAADKLAIPQHREKEAASVGGLCVLKYFNANSDILVGSLTAPNSTALWFMQIIGQLRVVILTAPVVAVST